MIYSQHKHPRDNTGAESHRISLNFKETEFCGKVEEKEPREECPLVLKEVGMVSLFLLPPLSQHPSWNYLFLGKIDYN